MRASPSSFRPGQGLICLCAVLALAAAPLAAADAAASSDSGAGADAFPTYDSYIKVSGQTPWVTGDSAAYAQRSDIPGTGSAGIEDLYYTKDLTDSTTVQVNGKALAGSDDYLASLSLSDDGLGSVDAGYKRFRIFYDGVGGFFPLADQFQSMSSQHLFVDRSSFWFDAKLARPNAPVFSISFHDEIRTGEKDSTIWAAIINPNATVTNGALVGNALPANTPYIAPNLMSLAEHHNILEGSVTDTIGGTEETLKATLDWVNNLDTRYYTRYPVTNVIADPTVNVLDDQEGVRSKSFRIVNTTETEINKVLTFETGLSFHHMSGEDGGEWITPSYNTTAKAIFNTVTAGNIFANPTLDDYVGNLGLKYAPTPNWLGEVGIRDEYNVIGDSGGFIATSLTTGATTISAANTTTAQDVTHSHDLDHMVTPEASLSYRGFDHLSLYASFDERITRGGQAWINPYAAITTTGTGVVTTATAPIGSVFFQQADQDYNNAKLGADWSPTSLVTIRAEVFRKDHQNRFIGADDIIGLGSNDAHFATGYAFTGVNLSVVLRPLPELSLTTRYQPEAGNMSVTGATVNGGNGTEVTSGQARVQMISETADWTPIKQFYAQASVNVVYNYLQTAYPTVVVTTTPPLVPSPIQNSNDNYVTGSALFGFVLDKHDDAQVQGVWQQATDYNPQIATGGQPYGASFLYESVTIGLKHEFTASLFGEAKVGYLRSTDGTTGGFTNYRGPLAYLALDYKL
jgi:hypothetical protein